MTTKKPRIFKQAGWWKVGNWDGYSMHLPEFQAASKFAQRLNGMPNLNRLDWLKIARGELPFPRPMPRVN